MRQNNLNEESGLAIGSEGEIKYKKEMDSIRKVEEKSAAKKQKKRDRYNRCSRKQIPKQPISPISGKSCRSDGSIQPNKVDEKSSSPPIAPEESKKHDEERRKKRNQQICEELEAISEVEENPNIRRNDCFAGDSSRIEPSEKEVSIDSKATPDP